LALTIREKMFEADSTEAQIQVPCYCMEKALIKNAPRGIQKSAN
jgi:hypothetical protein